MKIMYDEDGILLLCGDCRELLSLELDSSEQLAIVTDPPYGIKLKNHNTAASMTKKRSSLRSYDIEGDDDTSLGLEVLQFSEMRQIPIIYFGSPWMPWPGNWRNLIVWNKGGAVGGGGDTSTCLKRTWELIQVARNGRINGPRVESVWEFKVSPASSKLHPCQKPVPLMEKLLTVFLSPQTTVLDPFAGSGSTLVAAKNLGMKAVGVEICEEHCITAASVLRETKAIHCKKL